MSTDDPTGTRSERLFARAQPRHPGGVNSPVRVSRRRRHAALHRAAPRAPTCGTPTAGATSTTSAPGADDPRPRPPCRPGGGDEGGPRRPVVRRADRARGRARREIIRLVPGLEQVRLVSSGTEAAMSAIRLARGATGAPSSSSSRGCYHGHADALLVKAGSGLLPSAIRPAPACRPRSCSTRSCFRVQQRRGTRRAFAMHGPEIACAMVEPIAGNMNSCGPASRSCRAACASCARSTAPCSCSMR